MTDEELRELISSLAVSQLQTNLQLQQTDFQIQQTDLQLQETGRLLRESSLRSEHGLQMLQKETDRLEKQIDKLGKQMGELGNKFGSFTEGMAFPSMSKLLTQRFGADFVTLRPKKRKGGRTLEVDVLAVSNSGRNVAYVVEVKSHLKPEGVEQMLRILRDFPEFYPEQRDKQLYGVLALVGATDEVRREALKHGLYLAEISGDTFQLCVPEDFVPRSYQKPTGTTPPPSSTAPPSQQPSA